MGGTCAGTADEPPGRPPFVSVVWSRLIVAIILAWMARFCATAASSSAVAEACTARDSESKKRLAGSRFWEPCVRVAGCVTSIWRARTTSACNASSSSAEMNEADWKTVAIGEQMLPAESGWLRKKTSDEKSCLYTESEFVEKIRY